MILRLVLMFLLGVIFACSVIALLIIKMWGEYAPYPTNEDKEEMYMLYEEDYHGKH